MSDYVLHSVMLVSKEIAEANLQPIPGQREYAPGCNACFYRKHVITGADGQQEVVYCRQAPDNAQADHAMIVCC